MQKLCKLQSLRKNAAACLADVFRKLFGAGQQMKAKKAGQELTVRRLGWAAPGALRSRCRLGGYEPIAQAARYQTKLRVVREA
jgi:hypothetical protein